MELSPGQVIKIDDEKYDVLSIENGIDKYDSDKDEVIGEHTEVKLHQQENNIVAVTHFLKMYHDEEKIILERIDAEKTPEWLVRTKTRGNLFKLNMEKELRAEDISIE